MALLQELLVNYAKIVNLLESEDITNGRCCNDGMGIN